MKKSFDVKKASSKSMEMKKMMPSDMKGTVKTIAKYLSEYKGQFAIVFFCLIFSSLASVLGTILLSMVIDNAVAPNIGAANPDYIILIKYVAVMAASYLLGVFFTFLSNRLMINVQTGTLFKIRKEMFDHMQLLPIKYFDKHTHGELMSSFTNDTDAMREMISQGIPNILTSSVTVVASFTAMIVLAITGNGWPLLLLVLLVLVIMLGVVKVLAGRSGKYFKVQQTEIGRVNGYIEEMVEGQKVVQVFCHEDEIKKNFNEINDNVRIAATKANTAANTLMPIMGNLSYINFALVAILGALLVYFNKISAGTFVFFLLISRVFSMPLTQISQQMNNIMLGLAGAERIFKILNEKEEIDDGYVTMVYADIDENGVITESDNFTGKWAWKHPHKDGTLTYKELKGAVEFEDVHFEYEENKPVLNGISLYAKSGQKIALVGSTGAGKTTITNLINRFYTVPDGKIRYDGININKIKKDDLRRSLSMVLQDTHLFTGTVKENIRYGKLDATDEEIYNAAKLANADSFIQHLPQGYDTVLTADGANFSQGQRQLLSIARAAVANPPVLILDEATSSIDTRTEKLIEKGMDKLMENRTVFVIAHRLSTVRNANAILVIENGEIIERGTHEDLIKKKGRYFDLYQGKTQLD